LAPYAMRRFRDRLSDQIKAVGAKRTARLALTVGRRYSSRN
jgi:hypothetical protein